MSNAVTTLALPGGGAVDIPLPGSSKTFVIRSSSVLADSDGASRLPLIIGCLAVGVAIGVGATVWYTRR